MSKKINTIESIIVIDKNSYKIVKTIEEIYDISTLEREKMQFNRHKEAFLSRIKREQEGLNDAQKNIDEIDLKIKKIKEAK